MIKLSLQKLLGTLLIGLCTLALSGPAHADPPSRVARLAHITGAVSFSPGGEVDWVRASVNRPLITGDRLWTESGARSELQLGTAAIRLGSRTSLALLNVDDRVAQVQLTQGTLNIRIWRFDRNQVFEVNTPNLAYSIRSPGSYRIEVDANGESTVVMVRSGQAEVFGEGRAFVISAGQGFEFFDTGLRDYDGFALGSGDEFDRWSSARDQRWENSVSARYVSRDLIGYEDLDEYGTWREATGYGPVWTPTRVAADWAPYRDGHWAWVEPWGWTWVDDAPWGFAPSHYGRWASIGGTWAWVPGPRDVRPVYAPALVAFVGGSNFSLSLNQGGAGAVAWFPLGPREVYRPAYSVSRDYFTNVNISNTFISTVNITNFYNNANVTNISYVNQQVPGALVAVPTSAFVQSRSVSREIMRVARDAAVTSTVIGAAPYAPMRSSVLGLSAPGVRPPEVAITRSVVARTAPPPAMVPFAARLGALTANPGRPLDAAAAAAIRSAAPAPAAAVIIAAPPQVAPVPPPAQAPSNMRTERRQAQEERRSRQPEPFQRSEMPRSGSPAGATLIAPAPDVPRPMDAGRPSRPAAIAPAPAPAPAPALPTAPPVSRALPPAVAPVPALAPGLQEERPRRGTGQVRALPPPERAPVETTTPAPRSAPQVAPAPAPQASQVVPNVETPGGRQRPETGRAAARREAASDARLLDELRRRVDENQGRRP